MKKNKFINWVKTHKTKTLIVSGIVVTTIGTILLVGNRKSIKDFIVKEVTNMADKPLKILPTDSNIPTINSEQNLKIIDVREHLRNLPKGYHPSSQKILEAVKLGVDLEDNKTIISAYKRRYIA